MSARDDETAPARHGRDVALGLLLGVGLHVVFQGLAMTVASLSARSEPEGLGLAWMVPLLFWGVTQLVYVLPAYALARRRGARGLARGVAICGVISFLLWGGCVGLVMAEGMVL